MKYKSILALFLSIAILMTGCGNQNGTAAGADGSEAATALQDAADPEASAVADVTTEVENITEIFSNRDFEVEYDESESVIITLNGDTASCSDDTVEISGSTVTITDEGTYILSGTLHDGMIIVDSEKTDKTQLVLDGVTIHSETSAPIYILQSDKVFITTAPDSTNTLSNGGTFTAIDENDIDSVIFSKEDLTLNGSGTLIVTSPAGHGIVSKDSLRITSGSYDVNCASHGLSGKDDVCIADGDFTIVSGKDGIHAENADDATLGFVYIQSGTFDITAEGDGISAEAYMQLQNGIYNIISGGGSANGTSETSDFWGDFMGGGRHQGGMMGGMMNVQTDAQTDVQMEIPTEGQMELPTEGQMDVPTDGMMGGQMGNMMEIPTDGMMELPTEGQMEIPTDGMMELPTEGQMDVPMDGMMGGQMGNMMDVPTEGMTDDRMDTMMDSQMSDMMDDMMSGQMGDMMGGFMGEAATAATAQTEEDSTSMKGIKTTGRLSINGGTFTINSADDAVHSNGSITVNNGTFEIASGDDGFHAEDTLSIVDGTIHITESYEGLEGLHVEVAGGDITIVASDDGLNAAGGMDASGAGGRDGMFGGGMFSAGNGSVLISGGTIHVTASGDGIDANGTLEITGGFITVCGPTQGDTATLDYDTSAVISGGTFVGTGAYAMAQTFSDSEQGVLTVSVGNQSAGTEIELTDSQGNSLITYTPDLPFAIVILSSPDIIAGETYTLTVGSTAGEYTAK